MSLDHITDLEQLQKINNALLNRVESAMDQHGNAFSLFQTAINLEGQVKRRTDELTHALRRIEKTNAELALAKETSDKANLSKTKFLAAASHDVLQPLNAALLSISVLADIQETDLGKELAVQIERSLETMSELLGILIDISKLDAGVANPKKETLKLSTMLNGIQSDFSPIAEERALEFRFLGNTDLFVVSDRTMLRRILQNLVSNALRYTSKGGVLVSVESDEAAVHIHVMDTGHGIPEEQHENIFEEFNRGALPSGHLREANNGLGLGLSIVKRMARALNHSLIMRSKVNSGTRFSLTIEKGATDSVSKNQTQTRAMPVSMADLKDRKVLLIENDPAGITAMVNLLQSWHCDVRVSNTVETTISVLGDTDWIPDIVVADQHLDHGDLGTIAVQALHKLLGEPVPALIITADPTKSLEQKIRNMDMELMQKPVKPARLRALMTHMLSDS
ncbi:MAG: hybrid sensor histidine kinase/response regulator [Rhizobiaceae bacterium]|nr:hybrid sensor histidine kinase/response regulator [Rhizobiaceae bacterium]